MAILLSTKEHTSVDVVFLNIMLGSLYIFATVVSYCPGGKIEIFIMFVDHSEVLIYIYKGR